MLRFLFCSMTGAFWTFSNLLPFVSRQILELPYVNPSVYYTSTWVEVVTINVFTRNSKARASRCFIVSEEILRGTSCSVPTEYGVGRSLGELLATSASSAFTS